MHETILLRSLGLWYRYIIIFYFTNSGCPSFCSYLNLTKCISKFQVTKAYYHSSQSLLELTSSGPLIFPSDSLILREVNLWTILTCLIFGVELTTSWTNGIIDRIPSVSGATESLMSCTNSTFSKTRLIWLRKLSFQRDMPILILRQILPDSKRQFSSLMGGFAEVIQRTSASLKRSQVSTMPWKVLDTSRAACKSPKFKWDIILSAI